MTLLISKVGTLIQLKIGLGSVMFPIMWNQCVFLMTKKKKNMFFSSFNIIILGNRDSFY